MVKYFGDTNEWRLDKYFKEAQKFLDVNIEQKTIMELKDDIYIYKNVYNVKIGNFKAGSNQLQECKQSRISERLLITYIKDVLMKKCEYSFNKDEYSEWLTFMKIYGQQILIYTAELVGKDKQINSTMPKYFGGIAKKLKADTQVAS
jgi:hypothetical protein